MPYLSDKGYLAVIVEDNEGVAKRPDKFIPLVSESIRTDPTHTADRRMKGLDWKSDDILRGSRSQSGEIVVLGDPDNIGHCINMVMEKGITTGDAVNGFTHPFTVGNPKSYTIEIGKGNYAQRYFGVKGESLRLEFVDGRLQATLSIKAMGQFSVGTLAESLSGAETSLKLKADYDMKPIDGLCIGDIVTVGGVDVEISGFDGDDTIEFISTPITASIGDPVRLKLQIPSFTDLAEPFFLGNTLVGLGADETEATSNAGVKATATAVYEFVFTKLCNLLSAPASGSMDPIKLLPQTREGSVSLSQLFENEQQHQKWLDRIKQAITSISKGQKIGNGQEELTVKCYKVKLLTNEEPLEVGSYIFDRGMFEILYDLEGEEKALEIDLTNKSEGSIYESVGS